MSSWNRSTRGEAELERAITALKTLRAGLTDSSRRRLALRCREAAKPSPWGSLAFRFGTLRLLPVPVAAGALALFLTMALALLMVEHRLPLQETRGDASPVQLVKVVPADSGGVTLEWRDGPQRTYKVLKSNDPSNFEHARTYKVRGTRWTDESPSVGQVVYYKVE